MKNIDIKSLLLGIGIGIVLSSIIGLIFTLGYSTASSSTMTKDQIITEAKKYGMVDNKSIFDTTGTSDSNTDSTNTTNQNSTSGENK